MNVLNNHGDAVREVHRLNEWIDALKNVRDAARALTEECKGGELPPSLGALARLESALSVEWKLFAQEIPQ